MGDGYRLDNKLAIASAELTAIALAIETVIAAKPQNKKIAIFADSKPALQALIARRPARLDLVERVKNGIAEGNQQGLKFIFVWVPSHMGIRGNEKADEMANVGRYATEEEGDHRVGISAKELTAACREVLTERRETIYHKKAKILGWDPDLTGPLLPQLPKYLADKYRRIIAGFSRDWLNPNECSRCGTKVEVSHIYSCIELQELEKDKYPSLVEFKQEQNMDAIELIRSRPADWLHKEAQIRAIQETDSLRYI